MPGTYTNTWEKKKIKSAASVPDSIMYSLVCRHLSIFPASLSNIETPSEKRDSYRFRRKGTLLGYKISCRADPTSKSFLIAPLPCNHRDRYNVAILQLAVPSFLSSHCPELVPAIVSTLVHTHTESICLCTSKHRSSNPPLLLRWMTGN